MCSGLVATRHDPSQVRPPAGFCTRLRNGREKSREQFEFCSPGANRNLPNPRAKTHKPPRGHDILQGQCPAALHWLCWSGRGRCNGDLVPVSWEPMEIRQVFLGILRAGNQPLITRPRLPSLPSRVTENCTKTTLTSGRSRFSSQAQFATTSCRAIRRRKLKQRQQCGRLCALVS